MSGAIPTILRMSTISFGDTVASGLPLKQNGSAWMGGLGLFMAGLRPRTQAFRLSAALRMTVLYR